MKSLITVPPQCLCRALGSVLGSGVREYTEDNLQCTDKYFTGLVDCHRSMQSTHIASFDRRQDA